MQAREPSTPYASHPDPATGERRRLRRVEYDALVSRAFFDDGSASESTHPEDASRTLAASADLAIDFTRVLSRP